MGKESIESFGFFGEYYPFRSLTLMMKGGGTSGPVGTSSYYGGAGFTYYDGPDLAFHVEGNFTSFTGDSNWTDFNASVEYMPFDSIPLSFSAGDDHALISGFTGTTNSVFAGIKYHFERTAKALILARTAAVRPAPLPAPREIPESSSGRRRGP